MLLLPDPRPLVERLGVEFFRQAPEKPGVYLMRDAVDQVLYIGKAKNLRQRLASYRVANPDRLRRRHLKLLRSVARIELQECGSESSALAHEAELLRNLRPRFNRAGTWPGKPKKLSWRVNSEMVAIALVEVALPNWESAGQMGAGVFAVRAALLRLLWCALQPQRGLAGMPQGWFAGRFGSVAAIPLASKAVKQLLTEDRCSEKVGTGAFSYDDLAEDLKALFAGNPKPICDWLAVRTANQDHPFQISVRESDLKTITEFGRK
jgi:predicted GIY-YIG superfamily endonuclease